MASPRPPTLLVPAALLLASLTWTASGADNRAERYQCPRMGIANCTSDNGVAFFDGCNTLACKDWHSAVSDQTMCRPARSSQELEHCDQLRRRLEVIQNRARGGGSPDVRVNCPQFSDINICSTADEFFTFDDGCNVHLCDGSGGELDRSNNRCPDAGTPAQLFFCKVAFNVAVREHTSRHACRSQVENAERICEVTWPGYRFGDICYDGKDFVCGPGRRLLTRPTNSCPLARDSESLKCRKQASEIADLLASDRGYSCPELQRSVICTEDNLGFVYNDGCNEVLCEGPDAGLSEGRACKLPFEASNQAGREFCSARVAEVRRKLAASRRHRGACITARDACTGPAAEGESYYDGCNYCTCLGYARSQCTKRSCLGFFGTDEEFAAHCRTVASRLE